MCSHLRRHTILKVKEALHTASLTLAKKRPGGVHNVFRAHSSEDYDVYFVH